MISSEEEPATWEDSPWEDSPWGELTESPSRELNDHQKLQNLRLKRQKHIECLKVIDAERQKHIESLKVIDAEIEPATQKVELSLQSFKSLEGNGDDESSDHAAEPEPEPEPAAEPEPDAENSQGIKVVQFAGAPKSKKALKRERQNAKLRTERHTEHLEHEAKKKNLILKLSFLSKLNRVLNGKKNSNSMLRTSSVIQLFGGFVLSLFRPELCTKDSDIDICITPIIRGQEYTEPHRLDSLLEYLAGFFDKIVVHKAMTKKNITGDGRRRCTLDFFKCSVWYKNEEIKLDLFNQSVQTTRKLFQLRYDYDINSLVFNMYKNTLEFAETNTNFLADNEMFDELSFAKTIQNINKGIAQSLMPITWGLKKTQVVPFLNHYELIMKTLFRQMKIEDKGFEPSHIIGTKEKMDSECSVCAKKITSVNFVPFLVVESNDPHQHKCQTCNQTCTECFKRIVNQTGNCPTCKRKMGIQTLHHEKFISEIKSSIIQWDGEREEFRTYVD